MPKSIEAQGVTVDEAIQTALNLLGLGRDSVEIESESGCKEIGNDVVIVCAGGILPTAFLRAAGVEIEVRHGGA